jgi:hypothetical protein
MQSRLRLAVATHESELPVLDVLTAAMPLVRPCVHEGPGAPGCERRADLPVENLRLAHLAVAYAVEAQLRHEQRTLAGQVLEPGQVGLEPIALLEVDVHADDVEG